LCQDTCPTNKGCSCQGENCQCCPDGAKEKIEHGLISVSDCNGQGKNYAGLDEFRSQFSNNYELVKNQVETQPPPKINGESTAIIKKDSWQNLRLIDQLTYLKGKIKEIKQKIERDADNLKSGETSLGQCYLADTYIDFLKTYEENNKEDKIILIQKTFSDPKTNQLINPSKYCQGFQYNNSTCYSQCQKACPESAQDIKCFSNCPVCDPEDENCLKNQNDCIKQCQGKQECVFGGSSDTFQGCMDSCKQECTDDCLKAFCTAQDITKCQAECNNNSKCLLDNENKCLINVQELKNCVENSRDDESLEKCADSAALCPYCSDQYAGYPECLKSPYSTQGEYSSSFIYQNPDYQVCQDPYKTIQDNSNCLSLYPETAKCPSASKCPQCPCDVNASTGESSSASDLSENRVCSGECDSSAYNDDPLTFYCQQSWWLKNETKNTKPIGEERVCPKEKEIPIGRAIDNAEKWAQDFIDNIDKFAKNMQDTIDYIDYIGKEKNYCECDSKCDSAGKEPTCQAECAFEQTEAKTITTILGDGTEYPIDISPKCWCERQACEGNPCQKMINLLKGKLANDDCPIGTEYKGVEYYYNQINGGVKTLIISGTQVKRSDILKELSYSRKTANECSTVQNNYETQTRILSCTRVEDEIISPIKDKNNKTIIENKSLNSYCYGKALGEILKTSEPLADNWFCCESREKE
jgi:hypothetical protein